MWASCEVMLDDKILSETKQDDCLTYYVMMYNILP